MKRFLILLLSLMMLLALVSCGSPAQAGNTSEPPANSVQMPPAGNQEAKADDSTPANTTSGPNSNILIAYFSIPEDVDTSGVDAVSGASIVVNGGEVLGSTEYVAQTIQQTIGGDLFRIETVDAYPLAHDPLVEQAAQEQADSFRPALAAQIENLDQYGTILLGYPNWWADLPMPLYSFLEEYDFSGKMIIPFVTHGGSRASHTVDTISNLQPNATVSSDALVLSRNDVAGSAADIIDWAENLNIA